ncbi:hypothetical protein, partial [Escherichia coli]|uniref:hypothetical protein n=1 Tax=Escherichia coli TaxID=562 RepID=UPI0011050EC5
HVFAARFFVLLLSDNATTTTDTITENLENSRVTIKYKDMKRGLLIIGLALSGITAVTLNAAIQNEIVNAISNNKDKRIEIKADELPVEVAKHLHVFAARFFVLLLSDNATTTTDTITENLENSRVT